MSLFVISPVLFNQQYWNQRFLMSNETILKTESPDCFCWLNEPVSISPFFYFCRIVAEKHYSQISLISRRLTNRLARHNNKEIDLSCRSDGRNFRQNIVLCLYSSLIRHQTVKCLLDYSTKKKHDNLRKWKDIVLIRNIKIILAHVCQSHVLRYNCLPF